MSEPARGGPVSKSVGGPVGGSAVTVRPAGDEDVDVLRRVAAAAYQPHVARIGRPPAPVTADYAHAVRSGQVWVAVADGQVIGFVILVAQPGYLLLENVAVLPAAQGRGIGGRLLHLAEEHARRLGRNEIRLYTNEVMTENLAYYPRRDTSRPTGPSRTASAGSSSASHSADRRPVAGVHRVTAGGNSAGLTFAAGCTTVKPRR